MLDPYYLPYSGYNIVCWLCMEFVESSPLFSMVSVLRSGLSPAWPPISAVPVQFQTQQGLFWHLRGYYKTK